MFLLIIFLALTAFLVHQFWYRRRNLPPGPMPLPLLGNMLSLVKYNRWEDKFLEWKQEFGPIYSIWIGSIHAVTVNSYDKCVELFIKDGDSFVDRATLEPLNKALHGRAEPYGVFDTSGPLWLEQRRFSIKVLRDFGLGKNKMQERILEEIETLCENVNNDIKMGFKEHDFHMLTDIAIGSIINYILTGFRFTTHGNQAKFYKLKRLTGEVMMAFTDPFVLLAIGNGTLLKMPIFAPRFQKLVNAHLGILEFLNEFIEQREEQLKSTGEDVEPSDFVEAYLIEMKRLDKQGAHHYFSRTQLTSLLFDLWFAGQESSSNTMTWCIAYMIENEDVQQKLHAELDKVIGSDRPITMGDRQNLPYTSAVVMEAHRMSNIVSQNVFRKAAKDIEIDGILIKKGTMVIPQISVLAIDPENFKNPQSFNPDRFIDENGKLKSAPELLPFSLGKRACSGEGLARMEMFLFISNIFNRYKFSAGKERPTFKKVGGGSGFSTEPYKCRIETRY